MKTLNEYPAPETDARLLTVAQRTSTDFLDEMVYASVARSLEQRLAMAREALSAAMKEYDQGGKCWHSNAVAGQMRAALTATAPKL